MTTPKYPGWDIALVSNPGEKRVWVMVRLGLCRWIQVVEWKPNQFVAQVYNDGKLERRYVNIQAAVEHAEF